MIKYKPSNLVSTIVGYSWFIVSMLGKNKGKNLWCMLRLLMLWKLRAINLGSLLLR